MVKVIGIDVDDTLCSTIAYFLFDFNREHNSNIKVDDIKSFELTTVKNFSQDYIYKKLIKHLKECLDKYDILENSFEVLNYLKSKGYKLKIITSRRIELKEKTVKWLNNHFGENFFDDIIFYNKKDFEKCKAEIAKENNIDLLIEDAPHYVKNANQLGIKVLVFDRPWNKNLTEENYYKRVYSWNDIKLILENLNQLK
jgi:uncharacterized HAD superfamily protein